MPNWDPNLMQQSIALIVFVGCVVTIFALFGTLLVRLGIEYATKRVRPVLRRKDVVVLVLGTIGVLCVLYGLLIEPFWLAVEHVRLSSNKIHKGETVRVVQISDLHCDATTRLEDKLPGVISAEKPDVIVFTGDAINMPQGLPIFRNCLQRLAKIAPTFVVKGNWDAWFFKNLDRFGGTGAIELTGKPIKVRIKDSDVWIGGLPVGTSNSVQEVLKDVPEQDYRIFLFHYPDYIEEMAKNKIDLYLAGHTHGGQVALPFYGALITLATTGKKYESGLHHLGNTFMYTNRGIGMEGGRAPRVRFCARPEVTVIDITNP